MYKLIINTKAYSQASGREFKELVKATKSLKKKAKKKHVDIILVPQFPELKESLTSQITTFSQHCDNITPGSHTGFMAPQNIKNIGCHGTLINHSEHTLSSKILQNTIKLAKEAGLITCVCARTPKALEVILHFEPDMVALEPPELIGGDISITTAKPQIITEAKLLCEDTPLLVGAGVKTKKDVEKAIELGAQGILVASGIVKAQDKKKAIQTLLDGFP